MSVTDIESLTRVPFLAKQEEAKAKETLPLETTPVQKSWSWLNCWSAICSKIYHFFSQCRIPKRGDVSTDSVYVVETIPALIDKQSELRIELKKLVPICRREKGCISYELFQDFVSPSIFRIAMRWKHQTDYTAHGTTLHIKELERKFVNVLYTNEQAIEDVYRIPVPGQSKKVSVKPLDRGPKILCISYFEVKPEYKDELIRELLQLVELTQNEPGCIYYELYYDEKNPNLIILPSEFVSSLALDEHEKESYITRFLEGPMNRYCEKVTWNEALSLE